MVEVDTMAVAANQPIQVQIVLVEIAGVEIAGVEIVEVEIAETKSGVQIAEVRIVMEPFEVALDWIGNFVVAWIENYGLVEDIARMFALEFVAAWFVPDY